MEDDEPREIKVTWVERKTEPGGEP
jgi:hypothetical protein